MLLQNSIIQTLSESNDKIAAVSHSVSEFKENVGKVIIFLQTFEYDDVKDTPSYEASGLHVIRYMYDASYRGCVVGALKRRTGQYTTKSHQLKCDFVRHFCSAFSNVKVEDM